MRAAASRSSICSRIANGTLRSVRRSVVLMADGTPSAADVRTPGAQQLVAREWFGQIFVGDDDASAGALEQASLGTQPAHRRIAECRVVLDQRAGLLPVQRVEERRDGEG